MTDWIGEVGWRTELDTKGVEGGMAQAVGEVQAGMRTIDGMEARAKATIDDSELQRDAARIKAQIAALEREKINIKAKIDGAGSKAWVTRYKKELTGITDVLTEQKQQLKEVNSEREQTAVILKRVAAGMKLEHARTHGATQALAKHRNEIAKLRETYARLQRQMKLTEISGDPDQHFKMTRLRTALDLTEAKLHEYGSTARDINVDVADATVASQEKSSQALAKLRMDYARTATAVKKYEKSQRLPRGRGLSRPDAVQTATGERAIVEAHRLRVEIERLGGSTNDLDAHISTSQSRLVRWAGTLASTTVRVGPFTMSLKALGIALGVLGPLIVSVIGALSALVGTIGKGIIGAAWAGGAAVTALGLSFLAVRAAVAPYVQQLGFAISATNDYQEAVAQYGKGSDEAKTALKAMNEQLRAQPEQVQRIAKSFANLKGTWANATRGAKGPFFDVVENGLAAAEELIPKFANNAVEAMQAIKEGSGPLIASLKGPVATALDGLMDSFADQIPLLMSGLGDFTTGLARSFESVGRVMFGPGANGFADWAKGFADGTADAAALDAKMEDLRQNLAKTLELGGSAGGLLGAFFGTGSDTGMDIMDDMIGKMDEWAAQISSPEGQESLRAWFTDTKEMAQDLWAVLGDATEVFLGLSEALSGPTDMLLKFVHVLGNVAAGLSKLPGLGTAASIGLAGFLATKLPIVGGAVGAAGGLLGRGALGLAAGGVAGGAAQAAAQKALAKRAAAASAATAAERVLARQVAATTVATSAGTVAATKGAAGFGGLGAAALRVAGPLGVMVAIGKGIDEIGIFDSDDGGLQGTMRALDAAVANQTAFAKASTATNQVLDQNESGLAGVRTAMLSLDNAFKQGGDAGQAAFIQLKNAIKTARAPIVESQGLIKDWGDNLVENNGPLSILGQEWGGTKLFDSAVASIRRTGEVTDVTAARLRKMGLTDAGIAAVEASLGNMGETIARTSRQAAVLNKNLIEATRVRTGKQALDMNTGDVQKLTKSVGRKATIEITTRFNDAGATQKITSLANKLAAMGRKETVLRILARGDGAAKTAEALDRVRKKASAPLTINAKDRVSPVARKAESAVRRIPDDKNTNIRGRDNASGPARAAEAAIDRVPDQHDTQLDADGSGALATAAAVVAQISVMRAVIQVTAQVSGMPRGRFAGGTLAPQAGDVPGFASGGGYVNKPIFMVGEEAPAHPEFVIATNPKYRQDNVKYLMQAASALRIPGFKKGKGNRGYTPPSDIRVGAVPQGRVQSAYDKAKAAYDKAQTKVDSLEQQKKEHLKARQQFARDKASRKKGDPMPTAPSGSFSGSALNSATAAAQRAKGEMRKRKEDLQAVKRVNGAIENLGAQISLDTSQMTSAQAAGNQGKFNAAKAERIKDINALLGKLRKAARKAKGGSTFRYELEDRIAQLEGERTSVRAETSAGDGTLSANEQQRLDDINRDAALAKLTPDPTDDAAAGGKLVTFWEGVLNRLQTQGGTSAQVAEAASALFDAREAVAPGGGSGGVISSADAYNTARSELYRSFGGNALMAPTSLPSLPSPFGSGSARAAPGTSGTKVEQNISFTEAPSDAHAWAQNAAWEALAALS